MAAKVYTFNIVYMGCENKIWRKLEISSNSDLATLGYTVLATFDTKDYYLFSIECKGIAYETGIDNYDDCPIMSEQKLSSLKLVPGEHLELIYDFGCEQIFDIEFIEETDMKRGAGRAYPKIIDGTGRGIIDDMSASELLEIIEKIDRTGSSGYVLDEFQGRKIEWDYRKYSLKDDNFLLKGEIEMIRDAYEEEYDEY